MKRGIGDNIGRGGGRGPSKYAVTFDLDTQTLEASYGGASWRNAYMEIRKTLDEYGFDWQRGSVYFGGDKVDAVTCVIAIQELAQRFPWFAPSVRDIRMLRIEDNNDLMPAVERIARRAEQRDKR
jgi:virulence-associated protein VapD